MTNKITVVVGHKTAKPDNWESMSIDEHYADDWKPESFHRNGFWKKETISALARKRGFVGEIKVCYTRMDLSGKGRTYRGLEETITI